MEGLGSLLLLAALFILMMRFGCGAHAGHGGHARRKAPADDERGDTRHYDPVCGRQVPADEGYGKMQAGRLYRFCSRDCLDEFEAQPGKYLTDGTAEKHVEA